MQVIVVCGPTASGKSALAIEIARRFNGEIVSADSMQIYKEMNIGTAKPTEKEMESVPHHLINIKSVTEEYSVSEFVFDANRCIDEILSRNKVAVVVGGTGLYIDSLINNTDFTPTSSTDAIREKLKKLLRENGAEYVYRMLKDVDPVAAESIHVNNVKRVIRALEINLSTGKTLQEVHLNSKRESKYETVFIGLNYKDRQILYDRINLRVDKMYSDGLLEEVKLLNTMPLSSTARGAIGYKEFAAYLDNKCSVEQALELLKQKTRNYAKRQLTWFKRNDKINWFYPDDYKNNDDLIYDVIERLKNLEV